VAVRQAALVSHESALEACLRRRAIQIDDLYLFFYLLTKLLTHSVTQLLSDAFTDRKTDRSSTALYLDINASDMPTSKELHMMFLLVDRVIVDARVFAGIPVKDKLSVIQTSDSLLASDNSQIPLLQLQIDASIRFNSSNYGLNRNAIF